MPGFPLRPAIALLAAGCALLAACSAPLSSGRDSRAESLPACKAAAAGDPLIGNWLAIHSRKGIAGELHSLISLQDNGSMSYGEQLKRRGRPSQGLSETGCWHRERMVLVLRTLESNGARVSLADPIYTNRFHILSVGQDILRLQPERGEAMNARRMSAGYRLPF